MTPDSAPSTTAAQSEGFVTRELVLSFLGIAAGWLLLGSVLCYFLAPAGALGLSYAWLFALAFVSLVDLLALSKAVAAVLCIGSSQGQKRIALIIQASYWGFVKLACLGLFGLALVKAKGVPLPGPMIGMGTLVIVPLIGGYLWSQRILRHA